MLEIGTTIQIKGREKSFIKSNKLIICIYMVTSMLPGYRGTTPARLD